MQDIIYKELEKRCLEYGIKEADCFTALKIAADLNVSRNTVSQYLNELVKEGKVIKINTRPVYFYTKKEVEQVFQKTIDTVIFDSLDEFFSLGEKDTKNFAKLIGSNDSLRSVVEQCKAAISYPDHGLPLLIHGPTGTGKSMIASLLYEFAVDQGIIEKDKPFVSVNCSEYANNPELLTSNLFGHVKGAFTDAKEDNLGLIAVADGGLLFLDEVHCLPAECQEKLFFFMDKGMYHQLGDNENWLYSHCRIVFATTEDPQDVLLKTLLRRIPIMVNVPSLKDRPLIEKQQLLYSVFNEEAIRLQKNIEISNLVYQVFMDFHFSGNVGGMKNAIKAACASAFLNDQSSNDTLGIYVRDLPDYILETFPSIQLKGGDDTRDIMIPLSKLKGSFGNSNMLVQLYHRLLVRFEKNQQENIPFAMLVSDLKSIVQNYTDYLLYKNRYRKKVSENYLLKILDKIYSIVINKYSITISNNEINIYANMINEYAKNVIDAKMWVSSNTTEIDKVLELLENHAPREFVIAREIVDNVELNLDVELDNLMLSILTISLISLEKMESSATVAVILCHGYSTASSIANACNRLLDAYVFDGIDMELTVTTEKIVKQLNEYLKRKTGFKELILLVDMGSLEDIYKQMKPITDCNISIINNVNTKLALQVGEDLVKGKPTIMMLQEIEDTFTISTKYIEAKERQKVILTICATGFGAAKKISELLYDSIPKKVPVTIIPYDYQSLIENGINDPVFLKYDVVMIVGTLDPRVDTLPFIPVENLVMNNDIDTLNNLISEYTSVEEMKAFQSKLMKNFTLLNIVNHLTILNAEKLIDDVEDVVVDIEKRLDSELSMITKAGLYVHLSCLIERLILRNEVSYIEHQEEKLKKYSKFVEVCQEALSVVESRYSVEVPEAEILLIQNYFKTYLD